MNKKSSRHQSKASIKDTSLPWATMLAVVKNLPKGRSEYSVLIDNNGIYVTFIFYQKREANKFLSAAICSESVSGARLFINGKFVGARDGRGS